MTTRELIELLETMDPNATVVVVDPFENYEADPTGPYGDIEERIDNEGEFAVRINHIDDRRLVEIGSVAHAL